METLCYRHQLEHLKQKLGFENLFVVDRVGRSGGLALLWKAKFNVRLLKFAKNFIDIAVSETGSDMGEWRLTVIMGIRNLLEDENLGIFSAILLTTPLFLGFA